MSAVAIQTLDFPIRPCPVCGGLPRHLVFAQRFSRLSAGSLLAGYDLVACEECGLTFSDRIPEQVVFDRHYADMSKYEYAHRDGAESEFDTARFNEIAGWLSGNIPDRGCRILDVGCGTAGLLVKLRELGYASVGGLDPSPACAALARQRYGIEVRTGTLFDHSLASGSCDLIILVGVLEHVRDVLPAVERIGQCLAPGGMIFAEVPDVTAFADWPDAPYQELSIEHINFFGPVSLENLFRRSGFSMVALDRPPRQFTRTTVMPSAAALFRRSEGSGALVRDADSEPRLRQYLAQSAAEEQRVAGLIDALVQSGDSIVVSGVGTHTLHLMESTNFSRANIAAFTDVNSKYHGKELYGRPIVSPQSLAGRGEPILISSRAFQDDIVRMYRDSLKLPNRLILLYEI